MRHAVDHKSTLLEGRLRYTSLATQKLDAIRNKHALHDKSDAPFLLVPQTLRAKFHSYADIELEETLHPVEVPSVEVYVVDGRG